MSFWDGQTSREYMNMSSNRKNQHKRSPPSLERINGDNYIDIEVASASEYDSSDSASSNSSSSSSDSSSSNEMNSQESVTDVWDTDKYGEFINISCASNSARFYRNRFARGSVGRCVLFRTRWMTPNEFQAVSGRQSSKDWKRSIRLNGRCLKEYMNEGLFQEHNKTCTCAVCLGEDNDQLRHEGELALAAKRRRLSQADSGGTSNEKRSKGSPPAPITEGTSEGKLPGNNERSTGKRKQNLTNINSEPKTQRVWSPSGEMDQESSSNDEEEYKPSGRVQSEHEDLGAGHHPNSIIDISDFIPRRSRRSSHRKHIGHRTELGTYTRKPVNWDSEEVAEFLKLQGFSEYADSFLQCDIDGQSLFLLKEHHLLNRFKMKLGPALCLLDTVSRLKHPPPLP